MSKVFEGKDLKYIDPDYFSLATYQIMIGLSETGTPFAKGSAFLYKYEDEYYLITNLHNVTGRNPITKEPLSKSHAGIPDVLETFLRKRTEYLSFQKIQIRLYDDSSNPDWLVHPEYKDDVDVVALKLDLNEDFRLNYINHEKLDNQIPPKVGDNCFVIGYPFQDIRKLMLPVWKRASIATEPDMDEDNLPKLLIDTATRPGLSGSPVIYQREGLHNLGEEGMFKNDSLIGTIRGFLGVYSGRIGKGELGAQLGIVWKERVIKEIIQGGVKGSSVE